MRSFAVVVPGVLALSLSLAGSARADASPPIVVSGYTYHVGEHEGFDDADAPGAVASAVMPTRPR